MPLANDVQLWFKTKGPLALEIDVVGLMVRHLPADERQRQADKTTAVQYSRSNDRHVWKVGFMLKDNDFFCPCKYAAPKEFTRSIYRTCKADAELHKNTAQDAQTVPPPLAYGTVNWVLAFVKRELAKIRYAERRQENAMAGEEEEEAADACEDDGGATAVNNSFDMATTAM